MIYSSLKFNLIDFKFDFFLFSNAMFEHNNKFNINDPFHYSLLNKINA